MTVTQVYKKLPLTQVQSWNVEFAINDRLCELQRRLEKFKAEEADATIEWIEDQIEACEQVLAKVSK